MSRFGADDDESGLGSAGVESSWRSGSPLDARMATVRRKREVVINGMENGARVQRTASRWTRIGMGTTSTHDSAGRSFCSSLSIQTSKNEDD